MSQASATASTPAGETGLSPTERIFVALDTQELERAGQLVATLRGSVGGFKVGKELFTAQGPDGVRAAVGGEPLFLDLKFHDIPNTVAGALRAAMHLRPRVVNVHASGGPAMLKAAVEAVREASEDLECERPWLIAVTVLTSLDDADLAAVGQEGPTESQVLRLARLAQDCGLDGVVCSPREIVPLRAACGADFRLVVPGIRPAWSASGDQKRVMTPARAIEAGADLLVIGRPITGAEDPAAAARRIAGELA
ncbi:orotidine-5'-phosphate decarboxylase [Tistlia consotensis]|uniref:Orotidine 5'-phosphate decarboxylase n=1 Tax=Tistlia consotensis USBA 355 TaxID=560819 RepID=A0A1Y6BB66_9PROT|nr:orotidine-5'-phosphate decarboxylase [Tistlia consotensis]SME94271.1 orotidine-5'-phosphate decarboxylase [Tistlia consotensis USBA 355]SNR29226.1 orotidine-5'-phosphate decarboxylase [Tistlia consotensis]